MTSMSLSQSSLHMTSPAETTVTMSMELQAGHQPRASGWEEEDFCLAPCHVTRSRAWVALRHMKQKARATLLKALPLLVFTVVIFQEKQTNVLTALLLKISSKKLEC